MMEDKTGDAEQSDSCEQPAGERWDPLGAPNDDEEGRSAIAKFTEHECCVRSHW